MAPGPGEAPGQLWEVVGGADKGGIIVRAERETTSAVFPERFATGALVEELELRGERLRFRRPLGAPAGDASAADWGGASGASGAAGPSSGWVSTRVGGKDLVVRLAAPAELAGPTEEADAEYFVDNRLLRVSTRGLGYRWRRSMEAKDGDATASWGTIVLGRSCGDGWLQVGDRYLPMTLRGQAVLTPAGGARGRCRREQAKAARPWAPVDVAQVRENASSVAEGMFYGLEFPFAQEMLLEYGPEWLTKAFQATGALPASTRVAALRGARQHEMGNNGAKTFFEVEYDPPSPALHTKLFAKYPFPLTDPRTISDRLSDSVYKQPQDFYEINAYRLLEAHLPVRVPKYYYGDISNRTTNFILITEQVQFADPSGKRTLAAGELEGPYDKCMDFTLRSDPSEYYYLLVRTGAELAGFYKAGRLGDAVCLDGNFPNSLLRPWESYGMHPGPSGDPDFKAKFDHGEDFVFNVAKAILPKELQEPSFARTFRRVLLTANAYFAESQYWRNRDAAYVSFTHNNLNVDNAYFWRDEGGKLDLGIFDWANVGAMSLGFKLYWWLYTADFEMIRDHIDGLLDCFVETYQRSGGPALDKGELRLHVFLSAVEQECELMKAVPQIYKMCRKGEWATIQSRRDPRIFDNVHGKSTLRLYLHCIINIACMIREWQLDTVLDAWVERVLEIAPFPAKDIGVS